MSGHRGDGASNRSAHRLDQGQDHDREGSRRTVALPGGDAADDKLVWVLNGNTATVSKIDPARNGIVTTFRLDSARGSVRLAAGEGAAWVTSDHDGADHPDRRPDRRRDGDQGLAVLGRPGRRRRGRAHLGERRQRQVRAVASRPLEAPLPPPACQVELGRPRASRTANDPSTHGDGGLPGSSPSISAGRAWRLRSSSAPPPFAPARHWRRSCRHWPARWRFASRTRSTRRARKSSSSASERCRPRPPRSWSSATTRRCISSRCRSPAPAAISADFERGLPQRRPRDAGRPEAGWAELDEGRAELAGYVVPRELG